MTKNYNLEGKQIGKLIVKTLVPKEKRPTQTHGNYWYCDCQCGVKDIMIPTSYLTGNGNYTQTSCGCDRKKKAFLTTTNAKTNESFINQFDDFEKYLFLHKQLTHNEGTRNYQYNQENYEHDILYFYYNEQFNKIYNFWLNNKERGKTFYDLAKPSLDHIIPKSRGGKDNYKNFQFLTVFENLAKRDMTWEEWENFKKRTNTKSDYFLENIL